VLDATFRLWGRGGLPGSVAWGSILVLADVATAWMRRVNPRCLGAVVVDLGPRARCRVEAWAAYPARDERGRVVAEWYVAWPKERLDLQGEGR
jgi:hypothetical protein